MMYSIKRFTEHEPLLKRLSWSFYMTTGILYEDLYSEACLAYCEAVNEFRSTDYPETKLSSFAYSVIKNRLIRFVKNEYKYSCLSYSHDENMAGIHEPIYEFFVNTSDELRKVTSVIFSNDMLREQLEKSPPSTARAILVRYMIKHYGYSHVRGWELSKRIKKELTHIETGSIILA